MQAETILTIASGAAGAALIGLLAAWIQSRREHRRWIREQRLVVYAECLRIAELIGLHRYGQDLGPIDRSMTELQVATASLRLLGPDEVVDTVVRYTESVNAYVMGVANAMHDRTYKPLSDHVLVLSLALDEARDAVVSASRKALEIRG